MLDLFRFSGRNFLLYASIAVFVILGTVSGIGAYDIYQQKKPAEKKGASQKLAENLGFDPFPNLNDSALPLAVFPDEKNVVLGKNATLGLAKKLSLEILAKNPQGPVSKDGSPRVNIPEAQEIISEFLEKGIKEFDYEALKPKIQDANIKIITESGALVIRSYVDNFFAILNKNLGERGEDARNINDVEGSAAIMVEIYNDYIKSFYELRVPVALKEIHKKELSLLIASKKIFEILRDYEGDPLKAAIALNAFESLKMEMADVYVELVRAQR